MSRVVSSVGSIAALRDNFVGEVICFALTAYVLAILARILGSWFPMSRSSPAFGFFAFLERVTEPVLGPARRLIPPIGGTIDISAILVLVAISIVQNIIGCRAFLF